MTSSAIHTTVYKLGFPPAGPVIQNLNYLQTPWTVSANVDIVSGAASYSVEYTVDDLSGDPTLFRWATVPGILAGQTVSGLYSILSPVTGIRLNLASNTGEVRFTIIQAPGSL